MTLVIAGWGTAVPQHAVTSAHAAQLAAPYSCERDEQRRLLAALYRRSGVRTRRSVLLESTSDAEPPQQSFYGGDIDHPPTTAARMERYEACAAPLAVEASRRALADAAVAPKDVTHLITVSCTGFQAPGVDLALVGDLGLSADAARTHLGFMGCHGALNGLRVARAFVGADPAALVLLCAVELCSLHHQYGWKPEQIVANALFADGAAAIVGRASTDCDAGLWQVVANGSAVIPDSEDLMGWRVRDHGFEMSLSPRVPDVILQHLRPWLAHWLDRQGLSIDAVGSWAIHPGGPRILQACSEAIGLQSQCLADSQETLAEFGNMSSPTVLFILDRLRRRAAPRPCVALAFGPGLAVEATLLC